jgi:hypothetical protein
VKEGVMPKETVYGELLPIEGAADDPNERPIVQVRWSRETEGVQVVTRKLGYEMAGPDDELTFGYGMYVTLGRRDINDLIRYLRRARDQAFGCDE